MNLVLDLTNGVSGDMVLGALLQMAFDRSGMSDMVATLERAGSVMSPTRIEVTTVDRGCGPALAVRPTWDGASSKVTGEGMRSHLDEGLRAVRANDRVSRKARVMLLRLLEAEMAVHNVRDMSSLHLHETGTPDTIVDIIGTCMIMDMLGLEGDWISATPVSLGRGMVSTEHGIYDVPVPAVRHMLRGVPARPGPVEGELATPTGMAVVLSMVEEWSDDVPDPRTVRVLGRGAGSRSYSELPNVLSIMEVP